MRLREHPNLLYKWPPAWAGSGQCPRGGEGILQKVQYLQATQNSPDRIRLVVEYKGDTSSGVIAVDDNEFLQSLYQELQGCIGQSIHEIGDLEIDL